MFKVFLNGVLYETCFNQYQLNTCIVNLSKQGYKFGIDFEIK